MMTVFKTLKNLVRRVLFHPFGYDVITLRKLPLIKTKSKPRKRKLGGSESKDVVLYFDLFGPDAVSQRRFYNIGAGSKFSHSVWTNVGIPGTVYGDNHIHIAWDIMADTPIPVEDGSAHIVYSSYTLEHVTDDACRHFLSEAHRILVTDGFLRVVVPDMDLYYAAWKAGDRKFYYREKRNHSLYPDEKFVRNPNEASLQQNFLWNFASSVSELHVDGSTERISDEELEQVFSSMPIDEAMDYCTEKCSLEVQKKYPRDHINWYNFEKMRRMMVAAGFSEVYRSGYGQSRTPPLRNLKYFDFRAPEIALYVEAIK